MGKIREILMQYKDDGYGDFSSKLIPNIQRSSIIGVRSPMIKKAVKEIHEKAEDEIEVFLNALPHEYHEENELHALLISENKDFDEYIVQLEKFLPFVTNWAVSDIIDSKVLRKNHKKLVPYIKKWINSEKTYTKRVAMLFIKKHFLDEDFNTEYLDWASEIRSDEYYVNMMTAWLFADALYKQWDSAIVYLKENKLDVWTHNKMIQKAKESFRITDEQKEYLKTLKRK